MKTLTLILSLIISSVALAEEPVELVKLRAIYDNSLRGEFQKVGKLYHGRLVELKKSFMEAKNLDGANAVDAEIKKLRETHGKMVVEAPEAEEKASPLDGVWQYTGKRYNWKRLMIFDGDKCIDHYGNITKWTLVDGFIETTWSGLKLKCRVDPKNPNIMHDADGGKFTVTRLKW
jgi:hypothetical protein